MFALSPKPASEDHAARARWIIENTFDTISLIRRLEEWLNELHLSPVDPPLSPGDIVFTSPESRAEFMRMMEADEETE
jgi:hypothetical protein